MDLIIALIELATAYIGPLATLVGLLVAVVELLSKASGPRENKNRRR